MRKKLVGMVIVGVTVCSILSACGDTTQTSRETETTTEVTVQSEETVQAEENAQEGGNVQEEETTVETTEEEIDPLEELSSSYKELLDDYAELSLEYAPFYFYPDNHVHSHTEKDLSWGYANSSVSLIYGTDICLTITGRMFIYLDSNGAEYHTILRDYKTWSNEVELFKQASEMPTSTNKEKIAHDSFVNKIIDVNEPLKVHASTGNDDRLSSDEVKEICVTTFNMLMEFCDWCREYDPDGLQYTEEEYWLQETLKWLQENSEEYLGFKFEYDYTSLPNDYKISKKKITANYGDILNQAAHQLVTYVDYCGLENIIESSYSN